VFFGHLPNPSVRFDAHILIAVKSDFGVFQAVWGTSEKRVLPFYIAFPGIGMKKAPYGFRNL
jgi:hypothetical protein